MDKVQVEGNSDLYRDLNNGAVVNSNRDEYEKYMRAKRQRNVMSNEINNLKHELDEIKQLLKKLTNGN